MTKDIVGLNDEHHTVLVNVHTAIQCQGQTCCIHNPSQHHMLTWSPSWDSIYKQMWRKCPHGLRHPDPDDLAYIREHWGTAEAARSYAHPCDGCCQPRKETADGPKALPAQPQQET